VGFKGFIPATFGTPAAAKFSGMAGIYLKQTTHDGLLRNPANKADGFEADVLQKFADPAYPRQGEKIVSESADGGKTLRVMLPLFYGKGCLTCHGEPKGEKDISGYKKEGANGPWSPPGNRPYSSSLSPAATFSAAACAAAFSSFASPTTMWPFPTPA